VLAVGVIWRDSVDAARIECEARLLREELREADAHWVSISDCDGKRGDNVIEPVDDVAPDIVGEGVGDCSELGRADDVDMPDARDDEDDDAHAVRSAESDLFGVGDPLSLGSDEE
jgi:hypothetical protein